MTFTSTDRETKPWSWSADRFGHGMRARYATGCRCDACREANRTYERERARARRWGQGRRLVDAAPVIAHIDALRGAGVGTRQIAERAKVSRNVMTLLLQGKRSKLREDNAKRILAVKPEDIADGARVPAGPTRELIRQLLRMGMTRGEIAIELGCVTPALQLKGRTVTVRNARAVAALHARVVEQGRADRAFCPDCGHSHTPENRQRIIARMDLSDPEAIREAWPCFYGTEPGQSSGMRKLHRDLAEIRARVETRRSDGSGVGRGVK